MIDQWHIILGPWLATYLLHSTLLLGAAWLAVACFRRLPDEIRETLWKTALVGGVVTATLQVSLNLSPLAGSMNLARQKQPVLDDSVNPSKLTVPQPHTDVESATALHAVHDGWFAAHHSADSPLETTPGESPAPVDATATAQPPPVASPVDAALPPADDENPVPSLRVAASGVGNALLAQIALWRSRMDLCAILPVLALIIGLLALSLSFAGRGRLRAKLSRRVNINDGPLYEMLQSLTRRANLRRPARLTCSDRVTSPIAFGIMRGEICLPTRVIDELDPRQQQTLLAHELAHLVRRDPLWLALCQLLETLLLVQPLNRVARKHLQELAELACDDWAVSQTGLRSSLARCLTDVAVWMAHARRQPSTEYAVAMAGSPSALRRRVVRLLDTERRQSGTILRRWVAVGGAAVLGLAALTLPNVTHAAAEMTPPTEPQHVEASEDREAPLVAPRITSDSFINSLAALDTEILALTEEIAQLRRSMDGLPPDDELAELIRLFDLQLENLGGRRDLLRNLADMERNDTIDHARAAEIGPPGRPVDPSTENTDS